MLVLGLGLLFMGSFRVRVRFGIGPGTQPDPNIGGGHKSGGNPLISMATGEGWGSSVCMMFIQTAEINFYFYRRTGKLQREVNMMTAIIMKQLNIKRK